MQRRRRHKRTHTGHPRRGPEGRTSSHARLPAQSGSPPTFSPPHSTRGQQPARGLARSCRTRFSLPRGSRARLRPSLPPPPSERDRTFRSRRLRTTNAENGQAGGPSSTKDHRAALVCVNAGLLVADGAACTPVEVCRGVGWGGMRRAESGRMSGDTERSTLLAVAPRRARALHPVVKMPLSHPLMQGLARCRWPDADQEVTRCGVEAQA